MIEFEKRIKKQAPLIIYGAGTVAYYVSRYLISKGGYNILCFVVNNKKNNVQEIFGYNVYDLGECRNLYDSTVVVATLERLHGGIKNDLQGRKIGNTVYVSDDDYHQIRELFPDSDGEVFFAMYRLEKALNNILDKRLQGLERAFESFENIKVKNYSEQNAIHNSQYIKDFAELSSRETFELYVQELVCGLDEASKELPV